VLTIEDAYRSSKMPVPSSQEKLPRTSIHWIKTSTARPDAPQDGRLEFMVNFRFVEFAFEPVSI